MLQHLIVLNDSSYFAGSFEIQLLTSVLELPPEGLEGVGTTKVPVTDL